MSPEIAALQLEAGAWGLSVATHRQARTVRGFGARRIIIANQIVDPVGLAWLAAELDADPGFDLLCFADSRAGVDILTRHAGGRPFRVLVELGHEGGRGGCRSVDEVVGLAAYVQAADGVELAGSPGTKAPSRRPPRSAPIWAASRTPSSTSGSGTRSSASAAASGST